MSATTLRTVIVIALIALWEILPRSGLIPELFLPSLSSTLSAGCHEIIREWGAICVTGAGDVLEVVSFPGDGSPGRPRSPVLPRDALDPVTRRDAAGDFFGEENVPQQALTMGVGTILEARKIVILAFGEHKAATVQRAVEGEMTDAIAASFLQKHPDTTFILDRPASSELTAMQSPWMVGPVEWTPALIRRAKTAETKSGAAGWRRLKLRQDALVGRGKPRPYEGKKTPA